MAQELIYTSASKGLRPGTRGFCTVAYTAGMLPQSIQLLEALSAYKSMYAVHDERIDTSPVSYCHYRMKVTARTASILSRIAPTQADHTGRSNKIAHHVLLHAAERVSAGPARLAMTPGFFVDEWTGSPRRLAHEKAIPDSEGDAGKACAWEAATGDAGWAGVLADAFAASAATPAFVVYEPGTDVLPLFAEAIALLPPGDRWQVTFNTYFTALPAGASCAWRGCVPDADAVRDARRNSRALVIDLTAPLPEPKETERVRFARTGAPAPETETAAEENTEFRALPNRHKKRLRMRPYL